MLEEYGQESDLYELIQETQWPATERGAAMDSLAKALNARNVYTAAVNLDKSVEIAWDHPAIVHLEHGNEQHYVVWLPGERGSPRRVWDGVGSVVRDPRRFASLRTGPVLLTSDRPISPSAVVGKPQPRSSGWRTPIGFTIAVLLGFGCGYLVPQRQSHQQGEGP